MGKAFGYREISNSTSVRDKYTYFKTGSTIGKHQTARRRPELNQTVIGFNQRSDYDLTINNEISTRI